MESYPTNNTMIHLSAKHRKILFDESGIDPGIAAERGYYTARRRSEIPEAFADYQRRLGLVVPMFSPDGETVGYQLRPDKPRKGGPKYETPGGVSPVVDVHPAMLEEVRHGSGSLLITEGAKTGDAATSRGIPTVVLAGVWMWCVPKTRPYRLKPCFDHIKLQGREVFVTFDSDCMSKEGVQDALAALVAALEGRGAVVKVIYLPDAPDGSKQGIDDYLAAGGTIKEMFMLARRFDPQDLGRIRLARDEKLWAAVGYLWRIWYEGDWMRFVGKAERGNWARGHTARDTMEALIKLATRSGKADGRGVVVQVGLRTLSELAAKSAPSAGKAVAHLEADGQIEILPPEDKGEARRYRLLVPSATLYSMKRSSTGEGKFEKSDPRCKGLRYPTAPRLRWSSPGKKVKRLRGVVPGTRRVRETPRFAGGLTVKESMEEFPDRPYIKRLTPARGAILDALEDAGGELSLHELCEVLHRERPWDVRRRILPMLEEAGIIETVGDVVRLAAEWRDRLEEERERGGEISQAEKQAEDHRKQSARYRDYLQSIKDKPSAAGVVAVELSKEKRAANIAEHEEHQDKVRAADLEHKRFVKRFVHDRLRELGRIRLELLQEVLKDAGGTPAYALPAAKSLGCTVERLPEYGGREFVLAPQEWAA